MKIVLSYRRSDTEEISGRIFDKLHSHFGPNNVFMDVDSIPFGIDFRKHIQRELEGCDALLAIIGPRWLGGGKGLRIKEETDWVRLEVETALQRNIPVVPILVKGAKMPRPDQLPETLRDLIFRNAAPVESGRDFHPHMDRVIRSLDRLLMEKTEREQIAREQEAGDPKDPAGMANLGVMYEKGRGVPQDAVEAVRRYRKAADLGDANGMVNLGFMYEKGRGVPQDAVEAVRWYRKAADLGHANGMANLGFMYEKGQGVAQDEAEAVRRYRKAADLGHARGMNNLGVMYENGRGVPQDEAEALRWFRKAADLGQANAMNNLGVMYENGQGVAQDEAEALRWFRKAADLGHAGAKEAVKRLTPKS